MVQEAPGSNPGETPIIGPLPFQEDSVETKKGEGVTVNNAFIKLLIP